MGKEDKLKKIFISTVITASLLLAETECVNNDDIKKIIEFNEAKISSYQRYIGSLKKQIKELEQKLGDKTDNNIDTNLEKVDKISYSASNKTFIYTKPNENSKTNTMIEIGKEVDIESCDKNGWCVSSDNLYFKKFFLRTRMME